jgi:hypothetical protein
MRVKLLNSIACSAGIALLVTACLADWTHLLWLVGFPADKLYHPRVQGDLAILRSLAVVIATLLMISVIVLWKYPQAVRSLSTKAEGLVSGAAQLPLFIPLSLTALVLMKTVLQFSLYLAGYAAYAADDFGRSLSADYWLFYRKFDLGWEGWLGLGESGWLPFSDYLFGLGLAVNRDLYLTPKFINLLVSGLAVIAVYFLARELFGRTAGFITASLFAFQPWNVWLGISGMTSDLPSVMLITLFGLFLYRWMEKDEPRDLFLAAGFLSLANGFRYENWLFSLVFSLHIVFSVLLRWKRSRLGAQSVAIALGALTIINIFPIIWMAASHYVLGDWLPALSRTNTDYVSSDTVRQKISIPVLALASFPFEVGLSTGGILLFLRSRRRQSLYGYLLLLAATFLLFTFVVKGRLPADGAGVSRNLLPFVVFLLPFAGFLTAQLLRGVRLGRTQNVVVGCLIVVIIGTFDIIRAFNYPSPFPKDALHAGWVIRGLQKLGQIPENGRILIERTKDWGDLGIVALANKPERFVALNNPYQPFGVSGELDNTRGPASLSEKTGPGNQGVLGSACRENFESEACKNTLLRHKFELVILSSPERIVNFQQTFHARSWTIGRYHIFEMNPLLFSDNRLRAN